MKTKMIFSDFDNKTGVSVVRIANQNGVFEGQAKCHPADTQSTFLGCRIAEHRAAIKALKMERKIVKAQVKILKETYSTISHCAGFNEKGIEARKMRKAIGVASDKLKILTETIDNLIEQTSKLPAQQDAVVRKLHRTKPKK